MLCAGADGNRVRPGFHINYRAWHTGDGRRGGFQEMIKMRPAGERGKTRTNWLDGNHTFSFNRYYDPRWTGFRDLLVINEDFVAPASGFPPHSHADMEIITHVIEGGL